MQRKRRDEGGAALVEAAIAVPLLAILVFGILEYGLLLSNASKVAAGIRGGVRTAATMTNYGATSDYPVLQSMRANVKSFEPAIQSIVIYRASDPGGMPDASCQSGIADGTCNVYLASDLELNETQLLASGRGNTWPVASRSPINDYVGVYIAANYASTTGFFGTSHMVRDHSVMRIEPLASANNNSNGQNWPVPISTIPPTTTTTTTVYDDGSGDGGDDDCCDDGGGGGGGGQPDAVAL